MSRYSLFTTRVKTRRNKFAATKSLSECWDQAFVVEDDTQLPGFNDLPSPTIGGKGISRFDSQFNIVTGESTTPTTGGKFVRTFGKASDFVVNGATGAVVGGSGVGGGGNGAGSGGEASSSLEPSPRSSADPAVPYIWRRHVGTQCSIPQQCSHNHQVYITNPQQQSSHHHHHHQHHHNLHTFRHHPYAQILPQQQQPSNIKLLQRKYRSKSFDWNHFPVNSHSALWEPFCDLTNNTNRQTEQNLYVYDDDCPYCANKFINDDYYYNVQEDELNNKSNNSINNNTAKDLIPTNIVGVGVDIEGGVGATCEKCLSLTELKDEIENLTSNLVEQSEHGELTTKVGSPSSTIETHGGIAVRPTRPTLSFTLPIPQVSISSLSSGSQQPGAPGGGSGPIFASTTASSTTTAQVAHVPAVRPIQLQKQQQHPCGSCNSRTTTISSDIEHGREKSSTLPTIDTKHISAIRNAEKRRRFFARKQTNSAPDSFEASTFLHATHGVINTTRKLCGNCKEPVTNCLDGVLRSTRREKTESIASVTPSVEVWESEIRNSRCGDVAVTHVSELDFPDADPPCHFCCEQASTAIHDESRLQIVSGGLVRSRDGSARSGSTPYINLPSPNVQADNGAPSVAFGSIDLSPSMSQTLSPGSHPCHHSSSTSRASNLSSGGLGTSGKSEEEDPLVGPPASSLTRRPALVPPKIISDPDYENDSERDKCSSRNSDENTSPRTRRSSIVVIPPMQICPGDLLVYGKVLSQRKSLLGSAIESPSPVTSMFEAENTSSSSRKGKATWSILKLFERSSRTKGSGTATLEDIMSIIQPCDFSDPKLSRFKGMPWSDFVAYITQLKNKKTDPAYPMDEKALLLKSEEVVVAEKAKIDPSAATTSTTVEVKPTTTNGSDSINKSKKEEVMVPSPTKAKPLVRKRMGLMRTMSDRCLERRITPALWKATPGFLVGEKLVEGSETENTSNAPTVGGANTSASSSSNTGGETSTNNSSRITKALKTQPQALDASSYSMNNPSSSNSNNSSTAKAKPYPLISTRSEKDFFTNIKECVQLRGLTTKSSTPAVPEDSTTTTPDPDLRKKLRQKEALWDLFQSECSFLYDHLMVLKNVFLEPLKRIQVEGFAMYAEPELLFGNMDELCCVTYGFCKEFINLLLKLTDNFGELSTTNILAKLFEPSSKARTMSQAYHRYALNYINALNYLETLRRHAEFGEFEKLCMRDPRCKKLQLTDLLVSPVQHIMKVPLILKDIQSRTDNPQEKELIAQILEIQENSIRELDDKMRWLKNFERLLEIQRNIIWPPILEMEPKTWVPDFLRTALSRQPCDSLVVSPRRQIIHEGLLQLWDTGKPSETYVILFDDMLLITRRKKGLSKKKSSLTENWASTCGKSGGVVGSGLETSNHRYIVYRQPISLDRFFIHDIGEAENTTAKLDYAFVLVSLNRFQQIVAVHTFQAPSEQVKSTWLLKIKTTQDKWKRTLQNTVFRGVRTSTDSGQSNVASSILGSITKSLVKET